MGVRRCQEDVQRVAHLDHSEQQQAVQTEGVVGGLRAVERLILIRGTHGHHVAIVCVVEQAAPPVDAVDALNENKTTEKTGEVHRTHKR